MRTTHQSSKEEIERSTQRLHTTTRRTATEALHECQMSKTDEEKCQATLRRCRCPAETQARREHKKQTDSEPQGKKVVLTISEEQEAVSRLYEKSVQQSR